LTAEVVFPDLEAETPVVVGKVLDIEAGVPDMEAAVSDDEADVVIRGEAVVL